MKPAVVRYYFDADILGIGKLVAGLRTDVTYPGDPGAKVNKRIRPECVIQDTATPDIEWIAVTAEKGWVAISRNTEIERTPMEKSAVADCGSALVLTQWKRCSDEVGPDELLMRSWRKIEERATETGPYIYSVTLARGVRKIA